MSFNNARIFYNIISFQAATDTAGPSAAGDISDADLMDIAVNLEKEFGTVPPGRTDCKS